VFEYLDLDWTKLHHEELCSLYGSPNIIIVIKSRRMRWAEYVARMGEMGNSYDFSIGKLEGKRRVGRPKRRWEDNIRMDFKETGLDSCGSG
jgi:hypothetical protein